MSRRRRGGRDDYEAGATDGAAADGVAAGDVAAGDASELGGGAVGATGPRTAMIPIAAPRIRPIKPIAPATPNAVERRIDLGAAPDSRWGVAGTTRSAVVGRCIGSTTTTVTLS
jgi:hypothetical protein